MFLRNSWYVFGWAHELQEAEGILGRVMLNEPIVVWRDAEGVLHAMEDRCPHRRAPLSKGRVEGTAIRCMYHGMLFSNEGTCLQVPGMANPPARCVRTYPVVEKDSWIWVWMGDKAKVDPALIPDAFGFAPDRPMRTGHMDYDAHYQLIHDNLCDLSHVDFVHAATLRPISGAHWSETAPRITSADRGIRFERWFESADSPDGSTVVDTWNSYEFAVPGVFIMRSGRFPPGTASKCNYAAPNGVVPINETVEQQAVTPISERRTAYFFGTAVVGDNAPLTPDVNRRIEVVKAAFTEDREMIEAQQRIWDLTPGGNEMLFLPQDKGPFLMRKLLARLIASDAAASAAS